MSRAERVTGAIRIVGQERGILRSGRGCAKLVVRQFQSHPRDNVVHVRRQSEPRIERLLFSPKILCKGLWV